MSAPGSNMEQGTKVIKAQGAVRHDLRIGPTRIQQHAQAPPHNACHLPQTLTSLMAQLL